MNQLTCFKAYDIRGKLGDELNEDIAYRVGRAFASYLSPKTVVVGGDVRDTSERLKLAFAQGVMDSGADVLDIGLCGTEEVYFATSHLNADGGCMVTASHNPIDYNGMKMVRELSMPISGDTGLDVIHDLTLANNFPPVTQKGSLKRIDNSQAYIDHLLSYIDVASLQPLHLVVNSGNGAAGPTVDRIEQALKRAGAPITFHKMHHEPDSTFPNGIPNPLLHDQQPVTGAAVVNESADLGIAWDGDFDRCFFWDADGTFIEGYYVVGLLAEAFLQKNARASIIFDPRLTWNTEDIIKHYQGNAIQCKSGHAFIKEKMRAEDAVYGGEMSAHHYFKDFAYCDSGMIPWLLVIDLLSRKKTTLKALTQAAIARYPSPGEINSKVKDADQSIERVYQAYRTEAIAEDFIDGISLTFKDWRFNLRKSNTEPVVRLNLETRGDRVLMAEKTAAILALLRQ